MAQTAGIINGHNMRLLADSAGDTTPVVIGKATECSISVENSPRTVAHKDTGGATGWVSNDYGESSWSGQCNALFAEDETNRKLHELYTDFVAGQKVTIEFTTSQSGDYKFSGTAVITSMELNAPNNENVTYSITFTGDGALTFAVIV